MKIVVFLFALTAIVGVDSAPATYLYADSAAEVAKCRADEAKAFADETVEINQRNTDALIAETDPDKKTELIREQNDARLARTKARIAAIQADGCSNGKATQRIVSSGSYKNPTEIARCRAAEAKEFSDQTIEFERNNTDALIAENDAEKKTELIKQQNEARLLRNKIRSNAIRADNCAKGTSQRIVVNSASETGADYWTKLARCRANEAKAYSDETIQINKENTDALIAETDPEKKTELINQQNKARLARTQLRISAIQTDKCAKLAAATTTVAPIVETTTVAAVTETTTADPDVLPATEAVETQ